MNISAVRGLAQRIEEKVPTLKKDLHVVIIKVIENKNFSEKSILALRNIFAAIFHQDKSDITNELDIVTAEIINHPKINDTAKVSLTNVLAYFEKMKSN